MRNAPGERGPADIRLFDAFAEPVETRAAEIVTIQEA
jgi:hypothetical protein